MNRRSYPSGFRRRGLPAAPRVARAPKVLRLAFSGAETGFDPARVDDRIRAWSRRTSSSRRTYDYLARPVKLLPLHARRDARGTGRLLTDVPLRPGIYFADDPAFEGVKRELAAKDYEYRIRRFSTRAESAEPVPISRTADASDSTSCASARPDKAPFDYDAGRGPGVRDRYTLALRLTEPRPASSTSLADGQRARQWRAKWSSATATTCRASGGHRSVRARAMAAPLEDRARANPAIANVLTTRIPKTTSEAGRFAALKGGQACRCSTAWKSRSSRRRSRAGSPSSTGSTTSSSEMPCRVHPRWCCPTASSRQTSPTRSARLPHAQPPTSRDLFNLEDPVLGGYTPEKVALRRAISLAQRHAARSESSQGPGDPGADAIVPRTIRLRPGFRARPAIRPRERQGRCSTCSATSTATATAGASSPTASPLAIESATQPDQRDRARRRAAAQETSNAIGVRGDFTTGEVAGEPEERARRQAAGVDASASSAAAPDGQPALYRAASVPQIGRAEPGALQARKEFDAVFDQHDVAARRAGARRSCSSRPSCIAAAYVPYKAPGASHPAPTSLHPWVDGFRRPPFWLEWWTYIDIDAAAQQRKRSASRKTRSTGAASTSRRVRSIGSGRKRPATRSRSIRRPPADRSSSSPRTANMAASSSTDRSSNPTDMVYQRLVDARRRWPRRAAQAGAGGEPPAVHVRQVARIPELVHRYRAHVAERIARLHQPEAEELSAALRRDDRHRVRRA